MRYTKRGGKTEKGKRQYIRSGAKAGRLQPGVSWRKNRIIGWIAGGAALLIVVTFAVLALTGVIPVFGGGERAVAAEVMDNYLGRIEEEQYDTGIIVTIPETEADTIRKMILDRVEYRILSIGGGEMRLKVTALDMRPIMEEVIEAVDDSKFTREQFDEAKAYSQELLIDIIDEGGRGTVSSEVTVAYEEIDGEYVIEESDALTNAVFGGMLDMFDEINQTLGIEW